MRRIYESSAIHRDDEEPHVPNESDTSRPQAFRSIDTGALTQRFVPTRLRHWSVSIDVSTPRSEYPAGTSIPFAVEMKNAMPFPITITTRSRLLWQWDIDGVPEASHVEVRDVPDGEVGFEFDRGERKRFRRRWNGMFRQSTSEWEPAAPGEYTIGAGINVTDPDTKGLYDETSIEIVRG
ncbi:MAG: hypothetical protein ABEH88_10625, partial [Halobacteriales archaeon]